MAADVYDQDTEASAGGDVVTLFPDADQLDHERPLATKEKERHYCGHRRAWLDRDSRRVFCRDCSAEVDPFEVLLNLATWPERYVENRRALQRECRRVQERLDDLKRQERNAKARVRRKEGASADGNV